MPPIQIAAVDWAVLIFYLIAIAAVGIIVGLRVKDTDHYFLGKRRFGKALMIGQSFGTGTHAEMPVSLAGAVYSLGLSGIWYQWKNLFATPFYWLIAPLFRRIRRTTNAEMIEDRYGPWMGAIYTVFALLFLAINMASMLKGAAKVISQAVGGQVPVNGIVIAMTAVFILYSFVGGLVAAAWTDFLQGFLIIALSFMLIPLGWGLVGGLDGMSRTLEPYKLSLAAPEGIGPWFIFMLTVNGLIGIVAMPHLMAAVGTGKDEDTCRVGFLYGTFVKRFCTVGWAIVGLMAAVLVARGVFGVTSLHDPEEAFGFACRHLLFPGGVGLLIASVLAANMAGCSAFMVDSGALFTRNFYRKYLVRSKPDSHYLLVGRLSGMLITLGAVLYALLLIERVLYSFLLTETMSTFVGVCVFGGIFWRRATRWGAIASIVAAMGANFVLYAARGERLDHWDPNVFLMALLAGILALVVVSRLTPPEPEQSLRSFYRRLQTPSDESGVRMPEGISEAGDDEIDLHPAAKAGRQLLLVNLLQLRKGAAGVGFFRAYRTDLKGFAAGCAIVAALILLVWLLFNV
ncbi:MAG: sodium:solute symporter family protein [Bryobacterales bacterium]|nr:sodium:solute symporter family protein [Bryobacterales bacterium]